MYITPQNQTTFSGYYKIESTPKQIKRIKEFVPYRNGNILCLNHKKYGKKESIQILTGKHLDKFLDLIRKVYIRDLRDKLPKYLDTKPKKISATDFFKKF